MNKGLRVLFAAVYRFFAARRLRHATDIELLRHLQCTGAVNTATPGRLLERFEELGLFACWGVVGGDTWHYRLTAEGQQLGEELTQESLVQRRYVLYVTQSEARRMLDVFWASRETKTFDAFGSTYVRRMVAYFGSALYQILRKWDYVESNGRVNEREFAQTQFIVVPELTRFHRGAVRCVCYKEPEWVTPDAWLTDLIELVESEELNWDYVYQGLHGILDL